ncbi:hypothetical protein JMA_10130 [Jeotgalibacillus malaysiensis]|uniref:Uncharacterized protein n=1 Tax=Jeotgalibacillus malaysiensis TaxID=1508404 RepID=A0A0B5AJ25_9BACL|nr:hypothetical protein JMA_10130 [Jeotgalibacillus malaysiensis]
MTLFPAFETISFICRINDYPNQGGIVMSKYSIRQFVQETQQEDSARDFF